MGLRRTIGCFTLLLLLCAAAGGGYVWYLWSRTDELLHGRIEAAFRETIPDWKITFTKSRFDFQGQIRVYDLVLKSPGTDSNLIHLPESIVSVDREQLGLQRLIFQHIRLVQPTLDLVRNQQGQWNWEGLGKLPQSEGHPPELRIERGTIRVRLEQPGTGEPATAVLQNAHLTLTPSGKRRYLVKGTVLVDPVGPINLDGHWHLDERTWLLNGRVDQFKFRTDMWDKLCEFQPKLRTQLAALPEKMGFPLPGPPVTDPRLETEGNCFFRLQQDTADQPVGYKLLWNFKAGQWTHPLFPYPLDDVQGKLYCDSKRISIPQLFARHGDFQITLTKGNIDRTQPDLPSSGMISFKNLPLEASTRARLNDHLQGVYDQLQPAGKIDLNMFATYSTTEGLRCDSDVIPAGCSISHVKFPYPIEDLQGIVKKRGAHVEVDLTGLASQREVKINGQAIVRGPQAGGALDVKVESLPLDEVFVASAPLAARKVLRSMNLQGLADLHCRLSRKGDDSVPWTTRVWGTLHNGTMNCKLFPFAINDLEGELESDLKYWKFTKLKGTHGTTTLEGEGQYRMTPDSGLLGLTIQSTDSVFDQELELALPESWRKLWQELAPKGTFDCVTTIDWSPGQVPEITLNADLKNCALQLKSFPFPIDELKGNVSFQRDEQDPTLLRADLTGIEGKHDDTRMTLKNGFAILEPSGHWRVRLDELRVEDLDANNRFRRALPAGFREVVETLDPREGSLALNGMLEFRGTGHAEDGVTSAWDLEVLCAGTTMTAGIDLKHLYGKFAITGTWDGKIIVTEGNSDLTSMTILGYQFSNVKGPLSIHGNQLVIGCRDVVNARHEAGAVVKRPRPEERITGRAIQGVFTLDGIAVLGEETSYRVVLTMRDALLERYAELYLPNQRDLRGIMTGEAELSGRGSGTRQLTGRGQLLIRPAALYTLPVMLAVLKQLNGGSPNNTAFDEAQAYFEIANNRFEFKQVDLKGAALNLRGFGWVRFDRRLSFDFFSSVARNRAPLAILQQVVGQATVGWMGVEVRGSLDNPEARIRPAQRFDEAVKRFLGGIDPRPPAPPPKTNVGGGVQQRQ